MRVCKHELFDSLPRNNSILLAGCSNVSSLHKMLKRIASLTAAKLNNTQAAANPFVLLPQTAAPLRCSIHTLRQNIMKQYTVEWVQNVVQQLKDDLDPPLESEQENVSQLNALLRRAAIEPVKVIKASKDNQKKMKISIEGNIGAGKSTLLRVMDKWFGADMIETLPEPVDSWKNCNGQNLLESFYQDSKRYAYAFQSYAFISRLTQIQQEPQDKSVRILERSPLSDYCFAKNCHTNGLMDEVEWAAYQAWWSFFMHNNSPVSLLDVGNPLASAQQNANRVNSFKSLKPDAIIYLRTNPEICYKRMQIRNRSEETGVPLTYLQQLHDQHDQWFPEGASVDAHHQIPFVMLDANGEFETDKQLQMNFVVEFVQMIRSALSLPPLPALPSSA